MADSRASTHQDGERERDIFLEALDHAQGADRDAFVERACAHNDSLRAAVQALLANHKGDAFLETPALDPARLVDTELLNPGEQVGQQIGAYKLLQEIGEGACGTVYMAEQEEPLRRRVALKIIKPGMDSKSVIARFEAERQALALMDHPNIAKVLDAGTTESGRPYFVMELVRGIRVTDYCDQSHLSTQERLELFIRICHAIQHAHQKGIIHRDIKPSNILVTLHDGVAVPKVIDFGIAKAIEQRLTDKTVFTHFHAFIGTPAYTSPEQAEMSGLDIDTRSDIYSLGVLLYELLTGKTPFDPQRLVESGLDEMRRIIRQEEPVRPSTRLSTMGLADATVIMGARQARIPALVQAVRGDLDWIVMRCLEKDRTRRYPTANELALDVQRYLDSEPVLARPPSTLYRLQKFVHRNRVSVSAAAVVTVALVVALVVSTWMAIRARQAEQAESRLRSESEQARRDEATQRQRAERERAAALRRGYVSDMNVIQLALGANNYGRVVDLLERHRPTSSPLEVSERPAEDLRQWEWCYFWSQSRSKAAFALPTQAVSIGSVLISPNGRLLLTSDRAGAIKLWDLQARTEVAALQRERFGPSAVAFSRDGARVALAEMTGPRRASVRLWTVATRQFTTELPISTGVQSLIFTPDDLHLVTYDHDRRIRTWNLESRQMVAEVDSTGVESNFRLNPIFSPDARWVAVRHTNSLHVLNVATGATRSVIETPEGDASSLAFSPDGEILAAGPFLTSPTTNIRLFAAATGQQLGELVGSVSWVPGLAFTADGQRLISAGADQIVRVWDVVEFKEIGALQGHLSEVNCVAVTPDGNLIVSGCKDGSLLAWDGEHVQPQRPFEVLSRKVNGISFFPNSAVMLSVNYEGTVSSWDPNSLRETEQLSVLGSNVTRLAIAPDGGRVYAGTGHGSLVVLDWATRLVITNVGGPTGPSLPPPPGRRMGGPSGPGLMRNLSGPLGFTQNGSAIVTLAPGLTVRVFDTTRWDKLAEWRIGDGPPGAPAQVALSPNQNSLAVASGANIDFRNVLTGQIESTLSSQSWGVTGLAFSPDGKLFATSSVDGSVTLWDNTDGKIIDVLRGHLLGVHAVAFSPDGERLASISHGNEAVKLWDLTTRHEVATLAGQGSFFNSARFSPDGRLLVAINSQRTAYLWRAPTLADIAVIEHNQPKIARRP